MDANRQRRGWWRSPGRVLLVTLLVAAILFLACGVAVFLSLDAHFGSGFDARRFDKLETEFNRRQAAFTKADARMRELVAAHPHAERIGWTMMDICVRDAGQANTDWAHDCKPTNPDDQATFAALPPYAYLIIHQAKDPGRTFFRFYHEDPPVYTIMHAPDGTDAEAYAEDRGFRSSRALKPGWMLLGPIPDLGREDEQWQ
ncbi:hypothetical protein HDA40_007929 [Hamadaea flava]|uniref:Uncharacterized protein n=1 Tax=Hamadaea flava TaxID=1742688 RepID=A0ABV8LZN3_9ACTN|nr:hypothetical protein [Hamadaea flava]MCP2329422.1 hypothetical protein [Hamadaea flava]